MPIDPYMPIKPNRREADLTRALTLMVEVQGDQPLNGVAFYPSRPPLEDLIPTTWPELVNAGLIEEREEKPGPSFRFTPSGWLAALQRSGAIDNPKVLSRAVAMRKALKARVKGRRELHGVRIDVRAFAEEVCLPVGWVWNALAANLLQAIVRDDVMNASLDEKRRLAVRVPATFDMPRRVEEEGTDPWELLKRVAAVDNQAVAAMEEAVLASLKGLDEGVERLAALAWTVPQGMTVREIYALLEHKTANEIDNALVAFYDADGRKRFSELVRSLRARRTVKSWHPLLSQAISAYRRGHFAITIPALLAICEGLIMRDAGADTKVRAAIARDAEEAARRLPTSVTEVVWKGAALFVKHVFQSEAFDRSRPPILNRHWILHGRDAPAKWTQADSLRLFQAIEWLADLYGERHGATLSIALRRPGADY